MASALTVNVFFCCALAGPLHAVTSAAIATAVRHAFEWRRKVILLSQLFAELQRSSSFDNVKFCLNFK
jgi:hypothetical protein